MTAKSVQSEAASASSPTPISLQLTSDVIAGTRGARVLWQAASAQGEKPRHVPGGRGGTIQRWFASTGTVSSRGLFAIYPRIFTATNSARASALPDKVVQGALREVLEAVYEQDFVECSYGFRPGRSAHDAIRALNGAVYQGKVSWILEADIESFFDSLDRTRLEEMLRIRVADGSLRRLVGKCVRVGVLDGEETMEPERGTPQGSGLSPLLGNLYLHHTLDVWFEREVKPRLGGEAVLVRYCDDFVIGFERREDAQRVAEVLGKRMERFGLRLHPEKTRLIAFERPEAGQRSGKGPGTFDFLGFTMYWRRTRRGRWQMWCKTRSKGLRRFNRMVSEWCRRHRHLPVEVQHAALTRRLVGHFNYFGVNGNHRSLARVVHATQRVWRKWLRRRSQRTRLTWERFNRLLERFPLPRPRVVVRIWGRSHEAHQRRSRMVEISLSGSGEGLG